MDTVLSNAGAISKVILDGTSFAADTDISGMVEVTVPRGKEISSVQLELCSWRHIALKKSPAGAGKSQGEKSHVEQLTRQTLELFPNLDIGGAGRNGHDTKTLKDTAIFTFRFVALEPTKAPTTEAFATGRIKHYMTCFVHKRAGLLNREKLMEKNQFQIPVTAPVLEVDALFPDRTFTSLEARPNAANSQDYAFRVRCNTHLLSGLPFLVECDIAKHATARSITLSLHQRAFASIGKIEEEQFYRSLYVHEATRPETVRDGHFRGKSSPRPLAYGQKVYLVEWTCPRRDSRARLPFKETLYAKTAEANLECGLSLRIEMDLENGDRLVSVVHGITYVPDWIDARSDRQSTSLRQERSVMQDSSSPASSLMTTGRRLSTASSQSDLKTSPGFAPPGFSSFRRPQQAPSHLRHASHASSLVPPGSGNGEGYFERQRSQLASSRGGMSPRTPNEFDPVLTHGTYAPPRAGAVRTMAPQQPQLLGSVGSQYQDPGIVPGRPSAGRDNKPDQITLPPANVRSSMSMAFEHMNLAGSGPVSASASASASSQGARSPLVGQEALAASTHSIRSLPPGTPPPPSQPLPPPPPTSGGSQRSAFAGLGLLSGGSRPVSVHQPAPPQFGTGQANGRLGGSPAASVSSLVSPIAGGADDRPASRLGARPSRAVRPAVVLGVSQSTIQTMHSRDDGGGSGMASPATIESPVVPISSMLLHGSSTVGPAAGPEYHTGSATGSPSMHGGSFDVATRVTSPAVDGHTANAPANAGLPSRTGSVGLSPPSRSRTPSLLPAAGTTAGLVQGLFNMSGGGSKRASETPDAGSLRDSGYAGSTVATQRGTPPTQQSVPQPQAVVEQHQAGNEILLG